MPAPLTDRELLVANLARRDTIDKIREHIHVGFLCDAVLEAARSRNYRPGDVQVLLAEHERTTRGQVLDERT